jgi:excisionase family DNA binding protein
MKMAEQYLYSPIDVAKVMGISRSQVYNLMKDGHLASVHIGRSRRISRQQVADYIGKLEGVL